MLNEQKHPISSKDNEPTSVKHTDNKLALPETSDSQTKGTGRDENEDST